MNYTYLLLLYILAYLPSVACVTTTASSSPPAFHYYPKPHDKECHAPNSTRICDPGNLLLGSDIVRIQTLIGDYENTTTVHCRGQELDIQLGVYLYHYDQGDGSHPIDNIQTLAADIHKAWELGIPSSCGNSGVLLCVVVHRHGGGLAHISRGGAMSSDLPNVVIQAALEDISSLLKHERYREAIESTITSLTNYLRGDTPIVIPILERALHWGIHVLVPLLCCGGMAWIVRECSARRRLARSELLQYEEVKEELQHVKDNHYVSRTGRYQAESCAICQKELLPTKVTASEETPLLEQEPMELGGNNSLISLRCGHEFHSPCILQCMAGQRRNYDPCRCPVCMQGI